MRRDDSGKKSKENFFVIIIQNINFFGAALTSETKPVSRRAFFSRCDKKCEKTFQFLYFRLEREKKIEVSFCHLPL